MKVNSATKKKLIDIGIDEFHSHELARGRVWSEIVELSSGQVENICSVSNDMARIIHGIVQEKRKQERQEYQPLEDGSWPEINIEDTESQLLAKYSDDELILLASLNPGYGFRKFMMQLYPSGQKTSRRNASVMAFLKEIVDDEGKNYYEILQEPSKISWVTKSQYYRITGEKYLPSGYGSRGASGGKKANLDAGQSLVPLPPQKFDWGDVTPSNRRVSNQHGRFRNAAPVLLNIKFDLPRIWQYYEDGFTVGEVSREMMIPYQHANKWTNKMVEYEEMDILTEWLELVSFLNDLSNQRGNESLEDEKNDDIYMFIRKITRSYLLHPEKWTRRPSLQSLEAIIRDLEGLPSLDVETSELSHRGGVNIEIIGDQIDHNLNFRLDRMVSSGFYSPIVEQVARLQIEAGATSLSVCCGPTVSKENVSGLVNSLVAEYDCKVLIDSENHELIEHCKESVNHANLILKANGLNEIDKESEITWILSPPREAFELDPELYEFNQIDYFDDLISELKNLDGKEKIWFQPAFHGFFSRKAIESGSGQIYDSDLNLNAAQDLFYQLRILSVSGFRVVVDSKPALACLSSADLVKERLTTRLNALCLENGATGLLLDTNISQMTLTEDGELDVQINQLLDGSSYQLLEDYTPFWFQVAED